MNLVLNDSQLLIEFPTAFLTLTMLRRQSRRCRPCSTARHVVYRLPIPMRFRNKSAIADISPVPEYETLRILKA